MKYALIDTANTFFRARHVASRNSDTWEKIGMAMHLTMSSVNMIVRQYGIDHVVFCLEGRSWRKDFYQPKQMSPEALHNLRIDLYTHWDDHYPASWFPPSRMYKHEKIDTQSNRVIHRQDFDRLQHVCNLVLLFEGIYPEF